MQKVVMVRPDWEKGYIDKNLVCPMDLKTVKPVTFDPELLSHVQYLEDSDYLFTVRYYLNGKKTDENTYFVANNLKPLKVCTVLTISPLVEDYLTSIRNPDYNLFSILKGVNMSEAKTFDCRIKTVARFLEPLAAIDPDMYEFIKSELSASYGADCPITWGRAAKLPTWLNVRERLLTKEDGSTVKHTSEHWLLFHEDGSVTFPNIPPTKGAHIDVSTKRTIAVYNNPPFALPEDVIKAVKITLGVNTYEHPERGEELGGVALKLYKK